MLVIMADRMAMSVGDLFLGALIPGVLLGMLYIVYLALVGLVKPSLAPAAEYEPMDLAAAWGLVKAIVPAALLILAVLGSIFFGLATPPEAAGVGAAGALLLALAKGAYQPAGDARGDRRDLANHSIHFRRDSGCRLLQPGAARSRRR